VIRLALRVDRAHAEIALAELLELAPGGVEEVDLGDAVEYAVYGLPDDWSERWKQFHHPLVLGDRLAVRPPWEQPIDAAVELVIDPAQAFGTGAHATTRLCLELLLELADDAGRTGGGHGPLLDLGCGSGVLAIAAAKLGFGPVTALDHEEAATETASRNADANGLRIAVVTGDALADEPLPEAEVTVANIALEAIRSLASNVRSPRFVASGYLARDDPRPPGFRREKRLEREGWAADSYARE
jgi:ribosomal protein L11 methyltransferase